ncbi:MAG: hypothetical protein ACLR23_13310 [Clostridia bacterium]
MSCKEQPGSVIMAELTREDFSAALAEIYTSLLDYAAKQLPDPSLTQDAVHDAIVYAYQNWNSRPV